jgi:hypothetical protein
MIETYEPAKAPARYNLKQIGLEIRHSKGGAWITSEIPL